MRVLVLGGTAWLGGELARQAQGAGHEVVCLARGESGAAPQGVRHVVADRRDPGAYRDVASREWDLVVDVSWQPGLVRGALDALSGRATAWAYVSSCSVYADQSRPLAREDAALLPPLEAEEASREQYGEAKAACEALVSASRGDRALVVRSGLITGYGDPTDRFGYWVARFALAREHGGPVLVPANTALPAQSVNVQDLAAWMLTAGLRGTTGAFNASGPVLDLGAALAAARDAAGFDGEVVAVPDAFLVEQRVEEYMGPRSLPLWIVDPAFAGFSARDTSKAAAAGLRHRPLSETAADALRWERELGLRRERRAGLSPGEEQELLVAFAAWSAPL